MPKPFDLLSLLATFAREQGMKLTDPDLPKRFAGHAEADAVSALSDSALLHGHRTQDLFEALVVSLGRYSLFKVEDTGRLHASQSLRAPDFRIVLPDREQWLIEVKNVYQPDPDPGRQRVHLSATYMKSLRDYADLVQCPLRIAVYWARWGFWALVSPDRFPASDGSLTFTMLDGMAVSEFARLGDLTVGTTPPLRLRFAADPTKPRHLGPDGRAEFTISDVQLLSEDRLLIDPAEREFAWVMIEFGEWEFDGPRAVFDGSEIAGVEFISRPEEHGSPDAPFEIIGSLSRMFSRYYARSTIASGAVIQLGGAPRPEWFAPLASANRPGSSLPLWMFNLGPAKRPAITSAP